jgi:uncharacterized protein
MLQELPIGSFQQASSMKRGFAGLAVAFGLWAAPCIAQEFAFSPPPNGADPGKAMGALAEGVIAAYHNPDRRAYLDDLFRLQTAAGRYADAVRTLGDLHNLDPAGASPRIQSYEIGSLLYGQAKVEESDTGASFDEAYRRAFHRAFNAMDDRLAAVSANRLDTPDPAGAEQSFKATLATLKGKASTTLPEAIGVLRGYHAAEVARASGTLASALVAGEDERRFIIQKDIQIRTRDGAIICALVVRPRTAPPRASAALEFTIYADPVSLMHEARRSAGYGYVGVEALTRGKGCSPGRPVPYEHDGPDADAVIDWIAAQSWSDGQVGMFGGSYSGFTGWAALKHPPKALKAVDVGAPASPGVDVPMEGGVAWMFVYAWPFFTTDTKTDDDAVYGQLARWQGLQRSWYATGRAFRDLDKMDGTPNPIWDLWLSHPTYDAYWRATVPYGDEFSRIHVPVLQTAGYYYGGPGAAVYYLSQHYAHDPSAQHYLVIGPYDHFQAQRGNLGPADGEDDTISGLKLDPVALIDFTQLRYAWFDHLMKGGPTPSLLQDRINYEVTGANTWKHASSLAAMGPLPMRLYLSADRGGSAYRLTKGRPRGGAATVLSVNLADRSDVDAPSIGGGVSDKTLDTSNGLAFVSDPLPASVEASGLFSGQVDFVTNKKDFDFEIDLYELTADGDYIQLAPYWTRASQAADLSRRHMLVPGRRQRIAFRSVRLMSREMQAGSRIVAVVHVIKESGRQINYGTGKDVSDETIADAGAPLSIRWFGDSYVELPVAR